MTPEPIKNKLEERKENVYQAICILKSLASFDETSIFSVVANQRLLNPTEECLFGFYLRARGVVDAMTLLNNMKHMDVQATSARTILELVTEAMLLERISDAPEKVQAFVETERLRSVENSLRHYSTWKGTFDMTIGQRYVEDHRARILARAEQLWPKKNLTKKWQPPRHWSGLDLSQRTALVDPRIGQLYHMAHMELSWSTHGGLVNVWNLPTSYQADTSGMAFMMAIECFAILLKLLIKAFKLWAGDGFIWRKLDYAIDLPLCAEGDDDCIRAMRFKHGLSEAF